MKTRTTRLQLELALLGLTGKDEAGVEIDWSQEKVYLAGPMRGYPGFNFGNFQRAAAALRARGAVVFSPSENDGVMFPNIDFKAANGDLAKVESQGFCRRKAFQADTSWICEHATAIVMLPGWEQSGGVMAEVMLGRTLRLKLIPAEQALAA